MNSLLKWNFLFLALMMLTQASHAAWNIGSKGRVSGPSIHTTYFLTTNNAPFPVHAEAYVGKFVDGACRYDSIYDLGTETLMTGDFFDFDAFQLKSVIGTGYNCMTLYYTYKQLVLETFILNSDGINYNGTIPATSEVTIL